MSTDQKALSADELVAKLRQFHAERNDFKLDPKNVRSKRLALSPDSRQRVLGKTGDRCHICGEKLVGSYWHADHVDAHSKGGANGEENLLPACKTCNNYRWDYGSQEFQWILKLGVWLRTEIERETDLGKNAAKKFVAYDKRRVSRSKSTGSIRSVRTPA